MIVRFFRFLGLLWYADEYGWSAANSEAADARRYRWLKMECSPGAQTHVMQSTPWTDWDETIDRYMLECRGASPTERTGTSAIRQRGEGE